MRRNGLPKGAALLAQFRRAATSVPGGSWLRYEWRTAADAPLHVKGAHCSRLLLESPRREALAILCYGAPESAPPPPGTMPTPPPVAPSRSAVKAAALALKEQLRQAKSAAALHAAVDDAGGALATAAAEALGWEVTELPQDTLAGVHLAPP